MFILRGQETKCQINCVSLQSANYKTLRLKQPCKMRQLTMLLLAMMALLTASCGDKAKTNDNQSDSLSTSAHAKGDSTLYGLACEGCTDSVLVFLPFIGGDPVTYDIIAATKHKKIIGHPETGDWVGIILNSTDKKKADMVIDLDQLKGTWVHQAMPKLREKKTANVVMSDEEKAAQDSLIKAAMVPREQGFSLKRSSVAEPIGFVFSQNPNDESPVEYPAVRMYSEWHVFNGKLLLTAGGMKAPNGKKMHTNKVETDTIDFVFMTSDSLQLRFKDGVRNYYRKK